MAKARVVFALLATMLALSLCSQASGQMKLLSDNTGWALGVGLRWTTNDGRDWKDITPPAKGWEQIDDVFFLDTSNGWALLMKGRHALCCQFGLAATNNGGISWSVAPLEVPIWWNPENEVFGGGGTIFFLDTMHGWMDLSFESGASFNSGALFSTDDGGTTWQLVKAAPMIAAQVRFVTREDGWMLGGPGLHELYATHDGGATWQKVSLPPPPGIARTRVTNYYLPAFRSPNRGSLPVGFGLPGTTFVLFQTEDAGRTWKATKGAIPYSGAAGPGTALPLTVADSTLIVAEQTSNGTRMVLVKVTPDGRVETSSGSFPFGSCVQLSFTDPLHGWAGCAGGIMVTTDGGETWTDISPIRHGPGTVSRPMPPRKPTQPPQGLLAPSSGSAEASALAATTAATGGTGSAGGLHTSAHLGFDSTTYLTASQMATWWTSSPYYDIGVYLGGENTKYSLSSEFPSSSDPETPAQWVSAVISRGWGITPIWVGPQALCVYQSGLYTWSSTLTPQQLESLGSTEAASAESAAQQLALNNVVIYYDMENWDTADAACNQQVAYFINGWVTKLDGDKWKSGLYANSCPAAATWNLQSLTPEPDDIWVDRWDEQATIWGLDHDLSCGAGLTDPTWAEGFRMHQYLNSGPVSSGGNGTGAEAYGGISLPQIDRDIDYAQVAGGNGWKSYTFTTKSLPAYPGASYSYGSGINDGYQGFVDLSTGLMYAGQIVGQWLGGPGTYYQGYAHDPYTNAWLSASPGSYNNYFEGISNFGFTNPFLEKNSESFGQIVGSSGMPAGCNPCSQVGDGYLYTTGGAHIFIDYNGTGTAASWSRASGINDNCQNSGGCQAVGTYGTQWVDNSGVTFCYAHHGYVRPRGGVTPDVSFDYSGGGATDTYLMGINGFGQAVGFYWTQDGQGTASPFVYDVNTRKTSTMNLSALPACKSSPDIEALAINNNEQIAGVCRDSSGNYVAFLYDFAHASSNPPTAVNCGGGDTYPTGINDSTEIVGLCGGASGFIAWPQ